MARSLDSDGPFVALAKLAAAVLALVISIGFPAGYFYFGYEREKARINGEIELLARQVSQLISANPEYWQFETHRIAELIRDRDHDAKANLHRVLDKRGEVVAQSPDPAPAFGWPPVRAEKTLYDYGHPVGTLQLLHSLRSLYQRGMLVTVLAVLGGALAYAAFRFLPLRSLQRAWDRVAYLASHDALTGLPNRVLFLDRLESVIAAAPRQNDVVTVHSLDLDHFKDVNDTLGHAAGDSLLKQAAQRMQDCLRQGDTLARLAGDEFAIIQGGTEKPITAEILAKRVIDELGRPFNLDGHEAVVGVSIGMATFSPDQPASPDQLLMNADLALYKSKNSGRGTYHFFREDMDAALQARKALEIDLRHALRTDQLTISYQPQVDLVTQRIVGLEALIRWHHPSRGDVPPVEFIPVAESTGLIRPLSEWALRTACIDAARWAPLRLAVNLSASQLQQKNIVAMVEQALQESGLPADRLELEITEEVLISDTKRTLDVLNAFKRMGVRIAMDDFGTGYSSLAYLRRFPFDKIKIDRAFVADVAGNSDARAIVRAIVGLSEALSMRINAEGVETVEQAQTLLAEGCKEVQGYLYGHPMTREEMDALLADTGGRYAQLEPPDRAAVPALARSA
jgi:diguanylate cyclase (GGDEF)-like protein